jgi:hypothetical protein
VPVWSAFGTEVVTRAVQGTLVFGMLPVVPMTLVSGLLMVVVSKATAAARPSAGTLARYSFEKRNILRLDRKPASPEVRTQN